MLYIDKDNIENYVQQDDILKNIDIKNLIEEKRTGILRSILLDDIYGFRLTK